MANRDLRWRNPFSARRRRGGGEVHPVDLAPTTSMERTSEGPLGEADRRPQGERQPAPAVGLRAPPRSGVPPRPTSLTRRPASRCYRTRSGGGSARQAGRHRDAVPERRLRRPPSAGGHGARCGSPRRFHPFLDAGRRSFTGSPAPNGPGRRRGGGRRGGGGTPEGTAAAGASWSYSGRVPLAKQGRPAGSCWVASLLPRVEPRGNLLSDHHDAIEVGRPVALGEAAEQARRCVADSAKGGPVQENPRSVSLRSLSLE